MTIEISVWWVVAGSVVLCGSLMYALFKGVLFRMVMGDNEALREENKKLKLFACMRGKVQCRKTLDQDQEDHLERIAEKILKQNAKEEPKDNETDDTEEELPPMCVRCHKEKEDCGFYDETLTYCGDFYPPQNSTEVEAVNKEAAEPKNHAHYKSTKEALKESIGIKKD